ncbi:MAG: hypothetical protein AAGK14_15085 [Verrucomicrobiota bacterium]
MTAKLFRDYLGFLIGAPTICLCVMAYPAMAPIWEETLRQVPDITTDWLQAALYNLTDGLVGMLLFFGPFYLLGGLLGTHSLRSGAIAVAVTLVPVLGLMTGTMTWTTLDGLLVIGPGVAGGVSAAYLAYLLGYSVRRLTFLCFRRKRDSAPVL